MASLEFYIYSIMPSANSDSFTSSFSIRIPFNFFFRISNSMLNKVARVGIFVFFAGEGGGSGRPCGTAYGILVHRPGIKPGPLAVKMSSPSHWTTREFLWAFLSST